MSSFLPNNGIATFLPSRPYPGQSYIDNAGDKWIFNAKEMVWERSGPVAVTPLVSDKISGLISAEDKQFIDSIPNKPGGFGIIVQPQAVLVTPDNPEGTINGKIILTSDSIDITCVIGDLETKAACKPGTVSTLQCENIKTFQAMSFKIKEEFLKTLIIKPPIGTGPRGATGDTGPRGAPGFSEGPMGITGAPGQNVSTRCTLNEIVYNDLNTITDRAVVDLAVVDTNGFGCKMIVTDAPITAPSTIADKLSLTAVGRSIQYPEVTTDVCKASRLNDYQFIVPNGDTIGELYLTRLPDSGASTEKVELNNTYSLRTFIQDIVDYYIAEIKKVDAEYGKTVKAFISAIDTKARNNLADLANQLTQCQFNLPSIEYAISFVNCSAPPQDVKVTPCPMPGPTTTFMPGSGGLTTSTTASPYFALGTTPRGGGGNPALGIIPSSGGNYKIRFK